MHSCSHAPARSSKNGCVSSWKSRGVEVKAKLNHLAVDCKLSLAWFMILFSMLPNPSRTFCDTCFAKLFHFFFSAIVYSLSVSYRFFFVNGKYHSTVKAYVKRWQTCGYMLPSPPDFRLKENFIFKSRWWLFVLWLSLLSSDELWSIVCLSQWNRNPRDLLFFRFFLVHTKVRWRKNWVTNRFFAFLCMYAWGVYLFLRLYLFLISIVRFESRSEEWLRKCTRLHSRYK